MLQNLSSWKTSGLGLAAILNGLFAHGGTYELGTSLLILGGIVFLIGINSQDAENAPTLITGIKKEIKKQVKKQTSD